MTIKHIDVGAAPLLWSNVKHSFDSINNNFQNISLNDLADVNTVDGSLSIGDVLAWDGSRWEPSVASGTGAAAGISWTATGSNDEFRISSTFVELNDEYVIRQVRINNDGLLELELATFNPVTTAIDDSFYWDEAATGFNVEVSNPDDFTSNYIESVNSITGGHGFHTILSDYTAGSQSAVPDAGVDWTQEFGVNSAATILSNGSGLSGGNATATVTFNDISGAWGTGSPINYTWQNVNATINFSNLAGQNFLGKYNTVNYIVNISGLHNSNNADTTVTGAGGAPSNSSGSGTLTLTVPLHKNNNAGRSVALSTNFNRPVAVTGTQYTINKTDSDATINAIFAYPSFYVWTINNVTPPTRENIVDGNNFDAAVIELGHHTKNISTYINNSEAQPRCFWFAVRSSVDQPTVFETGPTESLLSTVSVTTGNTVDLEPDIPDPGYIAEEYTLYGITLQPGDTFVRIS